MDPQDICLTHYCDLGLRMSQSGTTSPMVILYGNHALEAIQPSEHMVALFNCIYYFRIDFVSHIGTS